MSTHLWWHLSRATGIVALVLLVVSFVWGILLSTRALRGVDRPAWLLATHTWLAGTGLVMLAAHLTGLVLDGWVDFGLADIVAPGIATWQGATRTAEIGTAVGVVAMYLMVIVQATSYLRRRLSRRAWTAIHRLSFPLVLMALVHAGWAGTDTGNRAYQVMALVLAMAAATATVIRVITPSRSRAQAGT
jgi:sulfoxide reductase heme-binding subunit YedZ